ncbi:MAG: hypothetical protein U0869_22895 [Chloroflexota bacterium]
MVDLCGVGAFISNGSWFTIQVSNLIWFGILALIIVLAIAIPLRNRVVDYTGYPGPGDAGSTDAPVPADVATPADA